MKIILSIIILIFSGLNIAGYYFYHFACVHDRRKVDFPANERNPWKKYWEEYQSNVQYIHSLQKQDCWITSIDGLKLHASFIPSSQAKRMIVCAHGYKGNGEDDFSKGVKAFHEDSSLLIIDERACGQSEGDIITFGALEKKDVIAWTEWLNENKNEEHLPIYLYGVSLGSATVCMSSDHHFPKEVKGIIADCGYASFEDIANQLAKSWFHIPGFPIIPFLNFFCKVKGHFDMKEADATKALSHSTLPVLFIHGTADTFVIPENTKKNYEACTSEKDVLYINEAPHAISIYVDSETYINKVKEFMKKHDAHVAKPKS